jgi:glycosyltransferase involved in cell wall biosynthesis
MIDSHGTTPAKSSSHVSAVIPCYNGRTYVGDAIRSVLGQTRGDLEVIVVDDGSSDDSLDVVRSIDDSRVRLVEHTVNRGIAAARNTGVREARGDYIAFLDQDDTWHPRKLEKQVGILDRDTAGQIGLVFTAREIVRDNRRYRIARDLRFPKPIENASRRDVLAALLESNFVWLISALVRKRCFEEIGLFSESIRSGVDDLDFCVRLVMKYRLAYVDEVLVMRREHGENYSDPTRMLSDNLDVIDRIVRFDPMLDGLARRRRSELYFRCGRWWQNRGEREKAREAFHESLEAYRGKFKAIGALLLVMTGPVGDGLVGLYNTARYGRRGG